MTEMPAMPAVPATINFARFDAQGRYTSSAVTSEGGLALEDAAHIYVGGVDIARHYHDVAAGQPVAIPPQPSPAHVFDYAAKTWIDPRTLIDFQGAQWEAIKAARTTALTSTFVWDGSVFDCNSDSQTNIRAAADRARRDSSTSLTWRLADNTTRTLNAAALSALGDALDVYVATQHAKASALRDQIYTATTVAQVTSINW